MKIRIKIKIKWQHEINKEEEEGREEEKEEEEEGMELKIPYLYAYKRTTHAYYSSVEKMPRRRYRRDKSKFFTNEPVHDTRTRLPSF